MTNVESSRSMPMPMAMAMQGVEERDNFIWWLKGEFAAANAIIDALCEHLRGIGQAREYEHVVSCIQQRRCNWGNVLHMQQFFSVSEVLHAIHQVSWRKQQQQIKRLKDHAPYRKDNAYVNSQRYGSGNVKYGKRLGQRVNSSQNFSKSEGFVSANANDVNSGVVSDSGSNPGGALPLEGEQLSGSVKLKEEEGEEREERVLNAGEGCNRTERDIDEDQESKELKSGTDNPLRATSSEEEEPTEVTPISDSSVSNLPCPFDGISEKLDLRFLSKQEENERRSMIKISKHLVGNEIVDGKMVNVVEGLELYENVFDSSELSHLTSLVQELNFAGRQKKLGGQTFVVSKRPMKGNGRETIQFGIPIINSSLENETGTGTMEDLVEPLPTALEDVIDRLFRWQILPEKRPDSCIINFFHEGDHSQPYFSPSQFERPFCIISLLSECSMVFGRSITIEHPGDYKGPFKISLQSGSLMVMQGNSADIARYAICSSPGPRVTITFARVQHKKAATFSTVSMGIPHSSSPSNALVLTPKEGRGANQTAHKHFNVVRTPTVVPVPSSSIHTSQVNPCPPAPKQPLFTCQTGPVGAFSSMAIIPPAWSAVPRQAPRMSSSGTGVFFPGSGTGGGPCQSVTLPQQQGVSVPSSGLAKGEISYNGGISTLSSGASISTLRSSKSTTLNRSTLENFDRDTEKSSAFSHSLPGKCDSAASKSALSKDNINKTPKMDSNGIKTPKGDLLTRTSSLSKRTAGGSS